jgi:hypothetical protein
LPGGPIRMQTLPIWPTMTAIMSGCWTGSWGGSAAQGRASGPVICQRCPAGVRPERILCPEGTVWALADLGSPSPLPILSRDHPRLFGAHGHSRNPGRRSMAGREGGRSLKTAWANMVASKAQT